MSENNEVVIVKLNLLSRLDRSILVVYLSTRACQLSDGTIPAVILDSARWGQRVDGRLPSYGNGKIVIENNAANYGNNRKFSDLLERYTPYNQTIEVFHEFFSDENSLQNVTLTAPVYSDKCISFSVSNNSVTLSLKTNILSDIVLSYEIKEESFGSAIGGFNSTASGKHLPYIFQDEFGFVESSPVRVNDSANTVQLAYGSVRGEIVAGTYSDQRVSYHADTAGPADALQIFAKDAGGTYRGIKPTSTSGLLSNNFFSTAAVALVGFAGTTNKEIIQEVPISLTPASAHKIVTGIKVQVAFQSATDANNFDVVIYEKGTSSLLGRVLTSATVALQGNLNVVGTYAFAPGWYRADLFIAVKPVVLKDSVYVGIRLDQQNANINYPVATLTGQGPLHRRYETNGDAAVPYALPTSTHRFFVELYGAKCTEHNNVGSFRDNKTGLSCAFFTLDAAVSGAINASDADLRTIDFIVGTRGLRDDADGTWTGTPNQPLARANDIIRYFLNYKYDRMQGLSGAWVPTNAFDESFMSGSHSVLEFGNSVNRGRILRGKTEGKTSLLSFLETILSEVEAQLVPTPEARVGLWPEGVKYIESRGVSEEFVLNDHEIQFLNYSSAQRGAVVNRGLIVFGETLTQSGVNKELALLGYKDYLNSVELVYDDNDLGEALGYDSFLRYGEGFLSRSVYKFAQDAQGATNILEVLIRRYAHPDEFVEFLVPIKVLEKYQTITLKQVIAITSVFMPYFPGASLAANAGVDAAGDSLIAENGDYSLINAKTVRAQIESIETILSQDTISLASIKCRVLNNPMELL